MDTIDTYYELLGDFDPERLRAILADDLVFEGPIAGRRVGADAFVEGAAMFARASRGIAMLQREPSAALYDAELAQRRRALRRILRTARRPHPDAAAALRPRGVPSGYVNRPFSRIVTPSAVNRPFSRIVTPSAVSRPSWRRSQIMSQCTEDSFVPPVSG